MVEEINEPRKIGGWLILIGLGLVIGLVRISNLLYTTFYPIFTDGSWEMLTTQGSELYSPIWAPLLISELVINLTFVAISIYILYLFFYRKSIFKWWYFGLTISSALLIVADSYATSFIYPEMEVFDRQTLKELIRPLVSVLIWTPYLFISERANATFIR